MSMLKHLATALAALMLFAVPAQAARVKDLGTFQGLRANQLPGYAIVVGLAGPGDDSLDYATLAMKGVASRFGLTLPPRVNPSLNNAPPVLITAALPVFANPGHTIDPTEHAQARCGDNGCP